MCSIDNDIFNNVGESNAIQNTDMNGKILKSSDKANLKGISSVKEHKRKVVNLSSHELYPGIISLLNKGLGFAIAPKNLPIESMICNIEDGIYNLSLEERKPLDMSFPSF